MIVEGRLSIRCKLSIAVSVVIVAVVWLPECGVAGTGSFDNGEFNFVVSVRYDATEVQLERIKDTFEMASQVLADATDGQNRFGTVIIVNNSGGSWVAEYWVHAGNGWANGPPAYGIPGTHINLFEDDVDGTMGDAYTVAHEFAHHTYRLYDEYHGPFGAAECAPPPDTSTLNYCLMDNYFMRGGMVTPGNIYTLNEFCVASNHDPDGDTWQQLLQGRSCWETLAALNYGLTAPADLPESTPPPEHDVDFDIGYDDLRVMLLLDRSGSMGGAQRMHYAKLAAKMFAGFLHVGYKLGVASFSSSASVNFALTEIIGQSTILDAQVAIDSLSAWGTTNIGGGLLGSLEEFVLTGVETLGDYIILLSDGDHNTGTPPSAAIPGLKDAGVRVLAVGVGTGISSSGEKNLQNVATQTGGSYFRISNALQLAAVFVQMFAATVGKEMLMFAPEEIGPGEMIETPVLVESGADSAMFTVTTSGPASVITMWLRTPSGAIIDETSAASDPNVRFDSGPNHLAFEVLIPENGTWHIVLHSGDGTPTGVEIAAFAKHDGVALVAAVEDNTIEFPEPIHVYAIPMYGGEQVVGASVTGMVMRPDGSQLPIILYDDGLSEHADAEAEDGIYSTRFSGYAEDGTYTFELTVVNTDGTTYPGEPLFAFRPSNEKPVPPFVRMGRTTAVVTGVPEYVVATLEIGPETLNLKSMGKFVTAYIELPEGFDPANIDVSTAAITGVDDVDVGPIFALGSPTELGDFDTDGIPDLMVKFIRSQCQGILSAGMRKIRIEGLINDGGGTQPFLGERSVRVIRPGN